ncbi:MAG: squalene synthase [Bacteroidales bacterium]|nr:squalene synthase [Bacteroidales bacterium]
MLLTLYKSALRPIEIKALLKLKIKGKAYAPPKEPLAELAEQLDDKAFCYAALGKVSRSFSVVIQQLPEDLKDAVCVFYLVLRALDTIEDDMQFPLEQKLPLLETFHEKTVDEHFSLKGVGDQDDYRVLLEHYPKVVRMFKTLNEDSQRTIIDITAQMGKGMADFSEKEIDSVADFDLYCHYVAGLVGIGLSGLFVASHLETLSLNDRGKNSNAMGLFLQKTNIIRDYHEDLYADRTFWPKEIWGQYADKLDDFANKPESKQSLSCLNHMLTDALQHIPACLEYLSHIQDEQVFRFTAIPQIMAIATMAKLYNNPRVMKGVVKVRKGLAAKLMTYPVSMNDVNNYFEKALRTIEKKADNGTPYAKETRQQIVAIRMKTKSLS